MTLTQRMRDRVDRQVDGLRQRLDLSLDAFDKKKIFTGPSQHFHARALQARRRLVS